MPDDKEEFIRRVSTIIRTSYPTLTVEEVSAGEVIINGRRLDLDNLYRIVNHETQRGNEIIGNYLKQLFSQDIDGFYNDSFESVRSHIMPRIHSNIIFKHLAKDMVEHSLFVNNTSIVYVVDMPSMTVSITTDKRVIWGLDIDDLDKIARKNLDGYIENLEINRVRSAEGGLAAIISVQDGYDAARLLLSGLYQMLAPELGDDFYVAIPARDRFFALSAEPKSLMERLKDRVASDYKRLPYPITDKLFLVTRDGIAGTSDGEGE